MSALNAANGRVYSVSEFSREVRRLLETSYRELWIEGEIGNLSEPRSGHGYFSLKDGDAGVRCVLFRQRRPHCATAPVEGARVLIRARASLYEPRGDFQLIVEYMEGVGEGALRRAMEALKRRLDDEGLFAAQRKKPPPDVPSRIGVITSTTGAAVRDVLAVLGRDCPWIPVVIYPTAVQGEEAPAGIVEALRVAAARRECDVVLLVRGGGSLEDLQAFNEESVARALAACPIPTVCGVGHETDATIADFVADVRAPTPTGAAQEVAATAARVADTLRGHRSRLERCATVELQRAMQAVDAVGARVRHPLDRIRHRMASLDHLAGRLRVELGASLHAAALNLKDLERRVSDAGPNALLTVYALALDNLRSRLRRAVDARRAGVASRLDSLHRQLQSLNPSTTLARGYAVVMDRTGTRVIASTRDVSGGERVQARLADGTLHCGVERVEPR